MVGLASGLTVSERQLETGRNGREACARCGTEMRPGSTKYIVRIQVLADWDGHLPAIEDAETLERAIRDALAAVEDRDEDELFREVYHSEVHLLCPRCRERFLANPLNASLPEALG